MVTPKPSRAKRRATSVRSDETGLRMVDFDNKCRKCGGLLDVEPAPAHAAGCICEHHRNVILSQKPDIAKMAALGSLDAFTLSRLVRGEWTPDLAASLPTPPVPTKEPACPPTKQLPLPTSSPKRARRTSSKKAK